MEPDEDATPEGAQSTVRLRRLLDELDVAHPGARLTLRRFTRALLADRVHDMGAGWRRILGPVATPAATAELLRITRRQLDGARARGAVLGVRTSTGRWVYPLRQFRRANDGTVQVLHRLDEVLGALYVAGDQAGAARWLAAPNRQLQGATPWAKLSAHSEADAVVEAAQSQARAWAGR